MYKCTDCEKTYNKKPDYCDCGNNDFLEFGEKKQPSIPIVMPFSYFSLAVFFSCIILSIYTVFFFGNGWINNTSETKTKSLKVAQANIPDIEKIWKEVPRKIEPAPVTIAEPKVEAPARIISVFSPPKNKVKEQIKQPVAKIVKPQIAKNIATAQKKTNQTNTTKNIAQKPTTVSAPKAQTSQSNESVIELNKYKAALRKALFFNLEILSVQGQGDCVIEFNIDDSGKLINRNFSKTSDNVSVNNAVYKMMMKLPQYYPPPPSYNGEKLRLKFTFDNGSYEINYI